VSPGLNPVGKPVISQGVWGGAVSQALDCLDGLDAHTTIGYVATYTPLSRAHLAQYNVKLRPENSTVNSRDGHSNPVNSPPFPHVPHNLPTLYLAVTQVGSVVYGPNSHIPTRGPQNDLYGE